MRCRRHWIVSTKNLPGYYFYGDAMYRGENREPGAIISFYTAEPGKVAVEIKDRTGKLVKSTEWDATKGFNRLTWRLDRNPLPQATYPSGQEMQDPRARYYRNAGGPVIPGIYSVSLNKDDDSAETRVKVSADPRMASPDTEALMNNLARAEAFGVRINELNGKLKQITNVRESLARGEELMARNPGFAEAMTATQKYVNEELAKMDEVFGRRQDGLVSRINGYRSLLMASGVPSSQEEKAMTDAVAALEEAEELIGGFHGRTVERVCHCAQKDQYDDRFCDNQIVALVIRFSARSIRSSSGSPPCGMGTPQSFLRVSRIFRGISSVSAGSSGSPLCQPGLLDSPLCQPGSSGSPLCQPGLLPGQTGKLVADYFLALTSSTTSRSKSSGVYPGMTV
ncbi:MAG: hypothetical protein U5L72_18685 [Bacteroidales bacterium]|nr:hypothetical protein [Bacteroidales bacterium]